MRGAVTRGHNGSAAQMQVGSHGRSRRSPPPPLTAPRRQQAALVSKRIAAAACSPELLRVADVGPVGSLRALRSLTAWLGRHGRHVRTLTLSCHPELDDPRAAAATVAGCLVAAGAAGQLQQLEVFGHMANTEWLAAVRSLQKLRLGQSAGEALRLSPAISGLSSLRSLGLYGFPVSWDAQVRLPTGITRLGLVDIGPSLPPQASSGAAQSSGSCEGRLDAVLRAHHMLACLQLLVFRWRTCSRAARVPAQPPCCIKQAGRALCQARHSARRSRPGDNLC